MEVKTMKGVCHAAGSVKQHKRPRQRRQERSCIPLAALFKAPA